VVANALLIITGPTPDYERAGSPHQNTARTWKPLLGKIAAVLQQKYIQTPSSSRVVSTIGNNHESPNCTDTTQALKQV
jgi:hypothetical protein